MKPTRIRARCAALSRRLSARLRRGGEFLLAEYRRRPSAHLLFCFVLPTVLMLFIYAMMEVWPFGKSSVLVLDLNGQYVYFFEALRDFVYGNASPLYTFSRALGGEFPGIYAYYLASPFSYLVALFPKEGILESLFLMLLLKCGSSGLTFGIYLRKSTDVSPIATVLFSTVWSLTAYAVVMQHNTMWIDNIILLPLIALGVRALIREGKYKLYTFSLTLAIMSNFYIGYMTCIFTLLYFFYACFSMTREERNPRGLSFHFPRAFCRFGFFSLTAGAIGALIIIPAVYSLTFGKTTFSTPSLDFVSGIDLFDLLTKFMFGSYDTVRPEGLPLVYCGVLTLLLIPFYFLSSRIRSREKGAVLLLSLVLIFSFSIRLLDLAWHGFQAPNWLNYRYSYMLDFLLVAMAAKAFDTLREHRCRSVLFSSSLLLLFLALADYYDYKNLEGMFYPILATLLCVIVYTIALCLTILNKKTAMHYASRCILVLVCLELFLAGLVNIIQLDLDVVISSRGSYLDYENRWSPAFESAKRDSDIPFYRMEKLNYRKVNDPFMLGYRGLSGSTSTLNRETIRFLEVMGYFSVSHTSQYTGTTPFADSFLSLRYIAGESKTVFPAQYEEIFDNGDVAMVRNPDALPIAFGVDAGINGITFLSPERNRDGTLVNPDDTRVIYDYASPFERLNKLASTLVGEDVELYVNVAYTYQGENASRAIAASRYTPTDKSKDSYIYFTVKGVGDNEIYAYFPTDTYTGAKYYLNGEEMGTYFTKSTTGYLCLGRYDTDETCTVSFKLGEEGVYIQRRAEYFYYMDRAVYAQVMEKLSQSAYCVDSCTEDTFTGRITVAPGQETILTTIAYDAGWIVTADGEEVTTYKTLDALLAFDLPAGEHTLTLTYMPRQYVLAFRIFLGGCGIFATVLIVDFLLTRKRKKLAALPAGKDTPSCSTTSEAN